MNPLILLLGLLGAGAGLMGGSSSKGGSSTTTARFEAAPPPADDDETPPADADRGDDTSPPVTDEDEDPVTDTNDDDETPTTGSGDTDTTGSTDTGTDTGSDTDTDTNTGTDTGSTDTSGSGSSGSGTSTTTGSGTSSPPATNTNPTAPTQTGGTGSDGGSVAPSSSQSTVDVIEGRVTTIQPNTSDITSITITSGVPHGNVTVNPDNTFALVMTQSSFTGSQSFTYEATHSDGSITQHTVDLNVQAGTVANGWSDGTSHYMLETDANDNVIVEYGDNHRAVYISGSQNALSINDIAALEGISASQITGSWLANSDYGKTEATALDLNAGMDLWNTITPYGADDTSNWLMFERGYTYDNYGDLLNRGVDGESEMNPVLIGAWGTGSHPVMKDELFVFAESSKNVVIQGLHFTDGMTFLDAQNIILDDLIVTEDKLTIQNSAGITLRNSAVYDVVTDHSEGDIQNGYWTGNDLETGIYVDTTNGFLLEGNFFDHNGWASDYNVDGDASGGQPVSVFNHNVYIQRDNLDVTVRDNISMRASSVGIQVRSGGFIEDNIYIDNNAAGNVGDHAYSLYTDNVITNAGGKDYLVGMQGALAAGIDSPATMSSFVDNIVAHLADPNGAPTSIQWTNWSWDVAPTFYDDTIVWNWVAADGGGSEITEQNVSGLDTSVLNQTTIQLFAEQLLGAGNGTIDALANYLRAQAEGLYADVVDADVIKDFFQQGFGIAANFRTAPTTLRFVPDDLGEGIRWDNRLNWDTDDLPGLYAQDSVDLGGNNVVYGQTSTIDTLDLSGGTLDVYAGRLTATGGIQGEGGTLNISDTGQAWLAGSDGSALDINVSGGRFANTGNMSGADLTATGGQTILATGGAEYDLDAGQTLSVDSSSAKVGFDSNDGGLAILDMHAGATLAFSAQDGDFGDISEFRSGAFGDTPNVSSGIDLGDATLDIDLTGLSASAGTAFTLMSADELIGLFGNATVNGLGARDANIVIDYQNDTVTLQLSAGNGAVSVSTVGSESDISTGDDAIWNALTAGQGVVSNSQLATASATTDPLLDDPTLFAA